MNDVPLIQKADVNAINTSIIAIKKQLKQLNEAVGLIDIPDVPSNVLTRNDLVDAVIDGDTRAVTSNAVAEVTTNQKNVTYTLSTQSSYTVIDGIYAHKQIGNIVQFAFAVTPTATGTSTQVTIATGLPKPVVNTYGWVPPANNASGTSCGFRLTTNGELNIRYGQANVSYQFQVMYVTSDV